MPEPTLPRTRHVSRRVVGLASYDARRVLLALVVAGLVTSVASAQSFGRRGAAQSLEENVTQLVEASCLRCHGDRTVTPLNLARLGFDLTDHETFKAWEKVYERVEKGEMPPAAAPQPDAAVVEPALGSLKRALVAANVAARGPQRAPLRRLTRLEYAYTIQDLLGIDDAIATELSLMLPAEADSGGFDTVPANQSMSPLHVRAYLDAVDRALDVAIPLEPPPRVEPYRIEYVDSRNLEFNSNGEFLGGGVVLKLDDGYVAFSKFVETYLLHSLSEGFEVPYPGRYRFTVTASPYQADTPVTLTLYRGHLSGGLPAPLLDELIGSFDLVGDAPRTVEVTPFLRPGDLVSPSLADADAPFYDNPDVYFQPDLNVRDYAGEGIALTSMTIEGPLLENDAWPPAGTRQLLTGVEFDEAGAVRLTKAPYEHVVDIVAAFAPRAFRRPLNEDEDELEAYAGLARPVLAEGRPFVEAIRVPLRAILTAAPFLFQASSPSDASVPGALDDFELATRLSYFLWRSTPDNALLDVARAGRLSDPTVLARQVDRMLDDAKRERFVKDFAGQAFRLYELQATSPDPELYPEYDDRLAQAMPRETELFLAELIAEDLGVGHLIDADFTFVNRRLAEHYGISGIEGQQMRKVMLPADSPRGGLLTQASIHKITANGTTTSPIPRGNFVLTNLLGEPAPPPPAAVDIPEPDTRGTTTIREQLDAHRASPVCASCHRVIDPPGFALESFDPIGGFRTAYRIAGEVTSYELVNVGSSQVADYTVPAPSREGPAVDASGVTPQGDVFSGIAEYKRLLLQQEVDQVARHFASSLVVYATGAEIEFADRDAVAEIVAHGRDRGHPIRTMIHEVVQSDLFRRR